jgi:hypothetical protein
MLTIWAQMSLPPIAVEATVCQKKFSKKIPNLHHISNSLVAKMARFHCGDVSQIQQNQSEKSI